MAVRGYVSVYYDVPARVVLRSKKARHPAYVDMTAEITFLAQFHLELAMRVG
jgi:hypothetical protein